MNTRMKFQSPARECMRLLPEAATPPDQPVPPPQQPPANPEFPDTNPADVPLPDPSPPPDQAPIPQALSCGGRG
jgi:hypothetical protein